MNCPTCGSEYIQRNRMLLLLAGAVMIAGAIVFFLYFTLLWIISLMLLAVAAYLIVWSTRGNGLWCRHCKNFPVMKRN